jgi:hypothetical protein
MSIAALGLIATSTLVTTTPAQAQIFGNINDRQSQMQTRINQGIRSGRLTRQEAFNLQSRMRQISLMESQFRNSRGLSFQERARLNGELNRLNVELSRQLNDSDRQWRNHRRFF